MPFSKYRIEADPISEDEPESPEKEIKIGTDEMVPIKNDTEDAMIIIPKE